MPDAKNSPLCLRHNFNDLIEKEIGTEFRDVLISSHEVMKLQNFESDVSDVIIANVQNNGALVFFACFFLFYGKRTF